MAAVLLAVCSTATAFGPAFLPTAGVVRASACRAGVCPQGGLRLGLHQAVPASSRSGRAESLVMMAKKKMTEAQLKALEALEAFEAVTGEPEEEDLSPAEEEKRKKREEKRAKKAAKKADEGDVAEMSSEESEDEAETEAVGKSAPVGGKKKKVYICVCMNVHKCTCTRLNIYMYVCTHVYSFEYISYIHM